MSERRTHVKAAIDNILPILMDFYCNYCLSCNLTVVLSLKHIPVLLLPPLPTVSCAPLLGVWTGAVREPLCTLQPSSAAQQGLEMEELLVF